MNHGAKRLVQYTVLTVALSVCVLGPGVAANAQSPLCGPKGPERENTEPRCALNMTAQPEMHGFAIPSPFRSGEFHSFGNWADASANEEVTIHFDFPFSKSAAEIPAEVREENLFAVAKFLLSVSLAFLWRGADCGSYSEICSFSIFFLRSEDDSLWGDICVLGPSGFASLFPPSGPFSSILLALFDQIGSLAELALHGQTALLLFLARVLI